MSESYEGVVFRSDESTARRAFGSIASGLRLRLVPLDRDVFGIYRVAGRGDAFDQPVLERIAEHVSLDAGETLALFYDNRCGCEVGVLYSGGRRVREFGDGDAWWVPSGEAGELASNAPRLREAELQSDEEYDCILSTIDAALESVGIGPDVDASLLKLAFCYEGSSVLAESGGSA